VRVDTNARAQIRLILDRENDLAKNALERRLKVLYAEHAAKGLLKSGNTIRVALQNMEELAGRLITDCTDKTTAVAKDVEAFAMIRECIQAYLSFLRGKVEDIAVMAGGRRHPDGISDSIHKAAEKLFSEGKRRLERQLEIHQFTFTVPSRLPPISVPLKPGSTEAVKKHPGGRPTAEFWDDMWASIATSLYAGDLQPRVQADIERAMAELIEQAGNSAADSTIRKRARKLWIRLQDLED
jgi:hypothetical protein